ncbi:MAG: translation elongation factor-like protein [Dehalococcoidales bacterium]|nr:translation elongation factor-like protein [Dehalococcoidales bacterium]MDD4794657.1 translation elongation factor-like protein [Dehalococcoidales bacterium]
MAETEIGYVSDYFSHLMVAGVELTGALQKGDTIRILGHTTDLEISVKEIQIEHERVEKAGPGQSVGIKVPDRVRKGDKVYKITA